jgi:hypothetical protein
LQKLQNTMTNYSNILCSVIAEGKRHAQYKRTNELATLYTALATGVGMDALLKKFTLRESDALFKQRVEITQHITKGVVANLMGVFEKINRANVQKVLTYKGEKETAKIDNLNKALSKFWGNSHLDKYLETRLLEINTIDPNAFVVIEFGDFDNTKERAQPYPFEVLSSNVLHYAYQNEILQYLIVSTDRIFGNEQVAKDYTLYLPEKTIKLIEVKEATYQNRGKYTKDVAIELEQYGFVEIGNKVYQIQQPTPHHIGYVPAFRAGYIRDLSTHGKSYVSPYDVCVEFLKKSIKVNSELDLEMSLIAFPLRIRYGNVCTTCEGEKVQYDDDGKSYTCPSCKGTGNHVPSTVAEEIVIPTPTDPSLLFDLDKLISYKTPPIDIIQFQKDYIETLTEQAKNIMFNSDIFSRKEIAETATGKNIDLQSLNDTLYKYARHTATVWEFAVNTIANITDLQQDLVCKLLYSKDFKLKGLDELLLELESINRSEASPLTRRNTERDIARIIYAENNDEFVKFEVREFFNPFSGFPKDEIFMMLTSDLVPRRKKVLYANLGSIFDEIEFEQSKTGLNFYEFDMTKIREIVNQKLEQYLDETKVITPTLL